MDSYTLVLLRRPPDSPSFSDEELSALQTQHLAHLDAMRARGLLVSGPFENQPDESMRGLCLYRTGIEETRRLAEADPMVKARRMSVDVFTWWTKPGVLTFNPPAV